MKFQIISFICVGLLAEQYTIDLGSAEKNIERKEEIRAQIIALAETATKVLKTKTRRYAGGLLRLCR